MCMRTLPIECYRARQLKVKSGRPVGWSLVVCALVMDWTSWWFIAERYREPWEECRQYLCWCMVNREKVIDCWLLAERTAEKARKIEALWVYNCCKLLIVITSIIKNKLCYVYNTLLNTLKVRNILSLSIMLIMLVMKNAS